jgi:uncharacterized membrane protein YfcA
MSAILPLFEFTCPGATSMPIDVVQCTASDVIVALLAIAVMAVGSALQATIGIGLALLVVPLLAVLDPAYIPGPMLMAGAVLAVATAFRERQAIDLPKLGLSLAGLAVGTVIGALVLKAVSGAALPKVFGVLVLLAVVMSIVAPPIQLRTTSLLLAGSTAGIMGTMVGIHGPPIALVFQNSEPRTARAMLGAFFAVAYLGSVTALAVVGLFGWPHVVRAAVLLPGVALGILAAPNFVAHVDRARLRWAILAVSTVSALVLLGS